MESALNKKEEKTTEEEKPVEEEKEKKEEAEQPKEEETKEGEYKKKERKHFEHKEVEIKEEDKLKIPEGAISVEDYFKQKQTKTSTTKAVEKPKGTEELQIKKKEDNATIGISGGKDKKERKVKEKKMTKEEEVMNQQVFGN